MVADTSRYINRDIKYPDIEIAMPFARIWVGKISET
jgi:hypothetical protein